MTTTTDRLTPEEAERFGQLASELQASGYEAVEEFTGSGRTLQKGMRVCHSGERYTYAQVRGTADVLAVMFRANSPWTQSYGRRDVEVIVLRDRPLTPSASRVGQWADYHTVTAQEQE